MNASKQPLVIIAAASADEASAKSLRQALLDRGVRVVMAAEVGVAEKKARLIVLCSPASLKCQTLNNFLEDFVWSNGMHHVHVVGLESERPVLPMALRAERRSNGAFWTLPRPPVIGALYNDTMSLEHLADEIAHECSTDPSATLVSSAVSSVVRRPLATGLAAACAVMLGVSVWQADQISAHQEEAEAAKAFSSRLLTDITQHLPNTARRETLIRLADDLTETYLTASAAGLSDDELGRRARLFNLIGEARDVHGDPAGAREAFTAAYGLTQALLDRSPANMQRVYDHAQSAYWVGNQAYRSGDLMTAERYFDMYAQMADLLMEREPDNLSYQAERGYAALNLGVIELESGNAPTAADLFSQAAERFGNGLVQEGVVQVADLGNALGWLADARREMGDVAQARSSREHQLALYEEQLAQSPGDSRTLYRIAHTQAEIASLATDMGEDDDGAQLLDQALDRASTLYAGSPDNDRYARFYVGLIFQRAQIALMRDDLIRAQLLIGEARRLAARTNENGENDGRYLSRSATLTLSATLALQAQSYESAVLDATQAVSTGEQSVAAGFETARPYLAQAYFVRAEALSALGQLDEANMMYRSALNQLGLMNTPRPMYSDELEARIAWSLGDVSRALAVRQSLEERGYARRSFLAFWSEIDQANTVEAEFSQGG